MYNASTPILPSMEYIGMNCKRCGSGDVCKSGFVKGKQRYLCKTCRMNFTDGDGREKHSQRVIRAAIELCVEGNGFRRISILLRTVVDRNRIRFAGFEVVN
jgi:transposase-like protein